LVPSRRGQQRDKIFRNAMRMALATMDDGDPGKALREIATACIEKAKAGDLQAAAFVRDTMDGKPAQMLEHTGEEGRRIGRIVHEIVHVQQEIIDNEIDGTNLLVDHRETEAINGHGSNGHGDNGGNLVPERVGRHRE